MTPTYLGNFDLLKCKKVAFFCSRNYSAQSVLRSYDWATELPPGTCVVSTFRSPIEKDVLHFLIKRKQPVIMFLGKRMYRRVPEELQEPLQNNLLLLVSNFSESQQRAGKETFDKANHDILSIVSEVTFGYLAPESSTQKLYDQAVKTQFIEKLTVL